MPVLLLASRGPGVPVAFQVAPQASELQLLGIRSVLLFREQRSNSTLCSASSLHAPPPPPGSHELDPDACVTEQPNQNVPICTKSNQCSYKELLGGTLELMFHVAAPRLTIRSVPSRKDRTTQFLFRASVRVGDK